MGYILKSLLFFPKTFYPLMF